MTEDGAFIRAIVDNPGDDLPRLVYADWLDDRSDPRGPYLRAELEWAKPWRAGERPADSPELRALANGLDPLWVARVSRPPQGVCCDHILFEGVGPVVTERDIVRFEKRRRWPLQCEHRAFLLNYNGGTPHARNEQVSAEKRLPELRFVSLPGLQFVNPPDGEGGRCEKQLRMGTSQRFDDLYELGDEVILFDNGELMCHSMGRLSMLLSEICSSPKPCRRGRKR